MGLMKGNMPVQEQVQTSGMTAEQRREIKTGTLILKLRRWWRIVCIIGFLIGCIRVVYEGVTLGNSILFGIVGSAVVALMWYALILYVFLYLLVGRTVQVFLYLKDLFGGSKETRL